jgi:hypothetical protein
VFLILDVEMVENFLLLRLRYVRIVVFCIELSLPKVNLAILLLHELDKVFVFFNEMSVLGK